MLSTDRSTTRSQFTVAFDVKRLADSLRYNWQHYGVTLYVNELYNRLKSAATTEIEAVAFAEEDEASLVTLEDAVTRVQAATCKNITRGWRPRNTRREIVALLRLLGRAPRGRTVLAPLVRRLDRTVFERVPFGKPTRWDIYHSPINALPPPAWTGTAVRVLSVMDVLHLKRPELFRRGTPPIRKTLQSVDVHRDYITCISECTREDVLSLLPISRDRVSVIPLAARSLFRRPRRDQAIELLRNTGVEPGRYVLALAQNDPRKNIPRLARAFRLATRDPALGEYVLVLVAARRNQRKTAQQLSASGLNSSAFRIVVDVKDDLLAGLYACAAAFAYVPIYEGFGIPALEAMSARCPLIVSKTSSLPEVAGDAGLYVDPLREGDIADGITRVLSNRWLRRAMRNEGIRQARQFSWEQTATKTVALYEQILDQTRTAMQPKSRA